MEICNILSNIIDITNTPDDKRVLRSKVLQYTKELEELKQRNERRKEILTNIIPNYLYIEDENSILVNIGTDVIKTPLVSEDDNYLNTISIMVANKEEISLYKEYKRFEKQIEETKDKLNNTLMGIMRTKNELDLLYSKLYRQMLKEGLDSITYVTYGNLYICSLDNMLIKKIPLENEILPLIA